MSKYKTSLMELVRIYSEDCNIDRVEILYLKTVEKAPNYNELYSESWDRRNAAEKRRVAAYRELEERLDALSAKADGFDLYRGNLEKVRH